MENDTFCYMQIKDVKGAVTHDKYKEYLMLDRVSFDVNAFGSEEYTLGSLSQQSSSIDLNLAADKDQTDIGALNEFFDGKGGTVDIPCGDATLVVVYMKDKELTERIKIAFKDAKLTKKGGQFELSYGEIEIAQWDMYDGNWHPDAQGSLNLRTRKKN